MGIWAAVFITPPAAPPRPAQALVALSRCASVEVMKSKVSSVYMKRQQEGTKNGPTVIPSTFPLANRPNEVSPRPRLPTCCGSSCSRMTRSSSLRAVASALRAASAALVASASWPAGGVGA